MPPREWKLRIEDMLQAIARIERTTRDLTFDAFSADELGVDGVIRSLGIIGEAARHVPQDVQKKYPPACGKVYNYAGVRRARRRINV